MSAQSIFAWVRFVGLGAGLAVAPACGTTAQGKVPVDHPIYEFQPPEEEEPDVDEPDEPDEPDDPEDEEEEEEE